MQKKEHVDILALDIDNVSKKYYQWIRTGSLKNTILNLFKPEKKIVTALNNITFKVNQGEILAYAGENGAGKSTTIKLLAGILSPTSGSVKILGLEPKKNRVELMKKIGILFGQRTELWWDHPVIMSYLWKKEIWGIPTNIYEKNLNMVIELLDLGEIINTFARELSLGQRLRADLGMLLLHNPEIIFLDEPTLGLDVLGKKKIISFLKKINREQGTTIVVTSHDMEELEELAERIILLSKGNIVFDGSFDSLRSLQNSFISYKFSYFGVAPRLYGMKLKFSDGYNHEYKALKGKTKFFLEQISNIETVENIEIKKVPLGDVIADIYSKGMENKMDKEILLLHEQIISHMKKLRNKVKLEKNSLKNNEIVKLEYRDYYEYGNMKKRCVVFLKGSGCSRIESCGGCTFCGFYNATNKSEKINDDDYIKQINDVMTYWDQDISKICCYNDGSLLCDKEMNFNALLKILTIFEENSAIKSVTLEAKVEDIEEEKIKKIRDIFSKKLEIAVGFESANEFIRKICINKPFNNDYFEEIISLSKKYSIDIIPLIMLKPPFLTENEAVVDFIKSIEYLEKFGCKRIDIELPTVEKDTLTFELWELNRYDPINLWSLAYALKIKKRLNLKTPLYVSPMEYSVDAYKKAFSCERCFDEFIEKIQDYNFNQDADVFDSIDCECKNIWEEKFFEENIIELDENIILERAKFYLSEVEEG